MRITCSKCAEFLDLNRLGLKTICKDCENEYQRMYGKYYTLSESEIIKQKSRARARWALRKGRLVPKPCEKCGAAKVEMHHEDYDKPLEVTWLCRTCHLDLHEQKRLESIELENHKENTQVPIMQAPVK